jgi:hypothetical protein
MPATLSNAQYCLLPCCPGGGPPFRAVTDSDGHVHGDYKLYFLEAFSDTLSAGDEPPAVCNACHLRAKDVLVKGVHSTEGFGRDDLANLAAGEYALSRALLLAEPALFAGRVRPLAAELAAMASELDSGLWSDASAELNAIVEAAQATAHASVYDDCQLKER